MKGDKKLKKYSKIAYISILIIALIFGFFIYKVSGKNGTKEDIKTKSLSEIKYLESKFTTLFNEVNNINFDDYKIIVKEEDKEQSSNTQASGNSESSGSSGESSGGSQESSGSQGGNESKQSSDSSNQNKQFKLEEIGILTNDSETNWNVIKNNVRSRKNIY